MCGTAYIPSLVFHVLAEAEREIASFTADDAPSARERRSLIALAAFIRFI